MIANAKTKLMIVKEIARIIDEIEQTCEKIESLNESIGALKNKKHILTKHGMVYNARYETLSFQAYLLSEQVKHLKEYHELLKDSHDYHVQKLELLLV